MRVVGLVVGVDRQLDQTIRALPFAARDAKRIAALLRDLNEQVGSSAASVRMLVGPDATLEGIRTELHAAVTEASASGADVFVIHFSGHGSPTGHLVASDSSHDAIGTTGLALSEVAESLQALSATNVVVTLDSCFSGTVLGMSESPNELAFNSLMQTLSAASRSVVWAAGARERAYESATLGHGLLSHGLCHALESARAQGQSEVHLTTWLQAAVDHAKSLALRLGVPQNPSGFFSARPNATIRVPRMGEHQRGLDADGTIHPVSAELSSLAVYGFSTAELNFARALIRGSSRLNTLQVDAIVGGGLLVGRSVLVRAPTSAGKTLIGALAALKACRNGRKAAFLLPTRALAREQANAFRRANEDLGLRVVASTGELHDDDDFLHSNNFDVGFFTYEKFAALIGTNPQVLSAVGVVVLDEVQLLEDQERGPLVELLLMRLRYRQKVVSSLQLVALCGEIGGLSKLEQWLSATPVGPGSRPVDLEECVVSPSGDIRVLAANRTDETQETVREVSEAVSGGAGAAGRPNVVRMDVAVGLVRHLVSKGQRVLVFTTTRPRAIALAEQLSDVLQLAPVRSIASELERVPDADRHYVTRQLLASSRKGVGVHTSDLEQHERALVETAFATGELQVLVSTTTLAQGVNTPADAVVVVDTDFWQGQSKPPKPFGVAEYRNMAGRAGRLIPNGPAKGRSFLVAHSRAHASDLWGQYVVASAHGMRSSLAALHVEDQLIRVLAVTGPAAIQSVADAILDTYWGYCERTSANVSQTLRRGLDAARMRLLEDGFVRVSVEPKVELTELGKICAAFSLRVESARRVQQGLAAMHAAAEPVDDLALLVLCQITDELDRVLGPSTPSARLVTAWDQADRGVLAARPATYDCLVNTNFSPLAAEVISARLRRAKGLFLWLTGRDLSTVEVAYGGTNTTPNLARLRAAAERTEDVLPACAAIAVSLYPGEAAAIKSAMSRVRGRLEVGGSVAAGALYRLNVGLGRRACLDLSSLGIEDEEALILALRERPDAIEARIGTSALHALRTSLNSQLSMRRRRAAPSDQLLLELTADMSVL